MKLRHRLLPMLALLVGAAIVEHADAATSLTVNCTFTISKDVHIVWTGTGAVATAIAAAGSNTANLTWAIPAVVLGGSYSTIGTTDGWVAPATDFLKITNNSLTADGVVLAVTPTSGGWTVGASPGSNIFSAACTAANTAPADAAAVFTAGTLVTGPNAFVPNLGSGATTLPIWFAITVPTSITTGGNSSHTIAFAFTGTAF